MIESISAEMMWLIVGMLFFIFEMFIPGFIIGFFGLGALVSSLTTLLGVTKSLPSQILVFAVISTMTLFLFHKVIKGRMGVKDKEVTYLNIEIGKIVPVTELIEPGETGGKVRYQGAEWSAESGDILAPGDSARVIGCNNLTLIVEGQKNA